MLLKEIKLLEKKTEPQEKDSKPAPAPFSLSLIFVCQFNLVTSPWLSP